MTDGALHTERFGDGRLALALAAAAFALVIVDVATGFALQGWGVVAAPFVLIVAVFFWGRARYGRIELTEANLIVGRDGWKPGDFDAAFGVRSIDVLTDEERAHLESPLPIPKRASIRMAGGAFGRSIGTDVLVLRLVATEQRLTIGTRRADELGPLLDRWIARPSAPGAVGSGLA